MNNNRRIKLQAIIKKLDDIQQELHYIGDAEETAFYNLADFAKKGKKGDEMGFCAECISLAISRLDDAAAFLEKIFD